MKKPFGKFWSETSPEDESLPQLVVRSPAGAGDVVTNQLRTGISFHLTRRGPVSRNGPCGEPEPTVVRPCPVRPAALAPERRRRRSASLHGRGRKRLYRGMSDILGKSAVFDQKRRTSPRIQEVCEPPALVTMSESCRQKTNRISGLTHLFPASSPHILGSNCALLNPSSQRASGRGPLTPTRSSRAVCWKYRR